MCNIYEFNQFKLIRDGCTRCMLDCYRDPSVLQFVAISACDAYKNLKRKPIAASQDNIFDRRNFTSVKAIWEDRKRIGGLCGRSRTEQKVGSPQRYAQAKGGNQTWRS
jgi:hypothetical protein